MENLMQGLLSELERVIILREEYRSVGNAGMFGVAMLTNDIRFAIESICNNDVVEMLQAFEKLKECQ